MASALTASPYPYSYPGQQSIYSRAPQHPPSPPIDDFHTKCTLPSIQSLIGIMAESPSPNSGRQQQPEVERQSSVPPLPAQSKHPASDPRSQNFGQPPVSTKPQYLPPTPPSRSKMDVDDYHQSPSTTSSHSSAAPPGPYYGPSNPSHTADPQLERHPPPSASHPGRGPPPPVNESPYQNSPYPPSPTNATTYSYPPPSQAATAGPPGYYQQPLPTNFPPAPPAPVSVPMDPALSNSPQQQQQQQQQSPIEQGSPWQHQHHHYISPSSSAAFASQSPDRYVCQTCNKAFSRPSSLRIHSHSHTGEKPFKCPHPECGKAFSVRSNMKRHERGCHGGSSPGNP
ncbi:MAG: hypothetical protein Q9222_001096 [Ikaeria aurantiellina]